MNTKTMTKTETKAWIDNMLCALPGMPKVQRKRVANSIKAEADACNIKLNKGDSIRVDEALAA